MEDANNLSFGIFSLNERISVTDACLVRDFDGAIPLLVIARGSVLQFVECVNGSFRVRTEYNVFGTIIKIIPLRHPEDRQSNILVVLVDKRFAVLRFSGSVTTVQSGSICGSVGVQIDRPFRIKQTTHGLLIQIVRQVIQFFRVTRESQLEHPFNCVVAAKSIIDFDFLGRCEKRPRIVVLTNEFKGQARVYVCDGDERAMTFMVRTGSVVDVPHDTYKLHAVSKGAVIAFATATAERIVFHSTEAPVHQSASIYTSYPLSMCVRMTDQLFLAADTGKSVMVVFIGDGGHVKINRIGAIDVPVALVRISEKTAVVVASHGVASEIQLSGNLDDVSANIRGIGGGFGMVKNIVDVNGSELVGLCDGGSAQVIRESLNIKKELVVSMKGATGVWFYGGSRLLLSFAHATRLAEYTSEEGFVSCSDDSIITEEGTIAAGVVGGCWTQVTRTTVNITTQTRIYKDQIICACIEGDLVSIVARNGDEHVICVIRYDGSEAISIPIPGQAQTIALNDKLVAISAWSERTVFVYSIATGDLVRRMDTTGLAMVFTPRHLVVVSARDFCTVYSLFNASDVRRVCCEGLHYGVFSCGDGIIVTGDTPVLFDGDVIKGVSFDGFTCGASFGDRLVLIAADKVFVCRSLGITMSSRDSTNTGNVVDAIKVTADKFIVASKTDDSFFLGVTDHPLMKVARYAESYKSYIAMTSVSTNGMNMVVALFKNMLVLYEFEDQLQRRSSLVLSVEPLSIKLFGPGFIVSYRNMLQLYELDIVSKRDVRLKMTVEMTTHGATSCIDCSGDIIAVADELQSLVLYQYDILTHKFTETARNCAAIGLSRCLIRDNDFFCTDVKGNIFRFVIGVTRNIDSCDLVIASSYAIGNHVNGMHAFRSGNSRIVLSSDLGQYFEILPFGLSREIDLLYRQLEMQMQSIGGFRGRLQRSVVIGDFLRTVPGTYDFNLFALFMRLDESSQSLIVSKLGLSLDTALDICRSLLRLC